MRIYIFGSEYEGDSIAFRLAEDLKELSGIEFIRVDDPVELTSDDEIVIMDAVKGIDKPEIFSGIDRLEQSGISTLHDFDLGYFLKLSEKLGKKKNITIIGVPMTGDYVEVRNRVRELLLGLKGSSSRPSARQIR